MQFAGRKTFLAIGAVWLLGAPAFAAKDCPEKFHLLSLGRKAGYGTLLAAGHAAKANLMPAVFLAQTARDIYRDWRGQSKDGTVSDTKARLEKDKLHWLAYLALLTLQRTTGITHNQFESETPDFLNLNEDDVVVVVDAFPENDPSYRGAGSYVYEKRYKGHLSKAKTYLIKPKNSRELIEMLWKIGRKHPITRLDYYGHGLPGMIVNRNEAGENGDSFWAAKQLATDEEGKSIPVGEIMADQAMIRFNTCFAANGTNDYREDTSAATMLGSLFFGERPNGGVVYASKVQVLPNWIELASFKMNAPEIPRWLRTTGDYLSPANGLLTFGGAAMLRRSDQDGEMEGIFHWDRVEKMWIPPIRYAYDAIEQPVWEEFWNVRQRKSYPELEWKDTPIADFLKDRATSKGEKSAEFRIYSAEPRSLSVSAPAEEWRAMEAHFADQKHLKFEVRSAQQREGVWKRHQHSDSNRAGDARKKF